VLLLCGFFFARFYLMNKYRRKKIYSEETDTSADDSARVQKEEFRDRLDFLLSNPYGDLYLVPYQPQSTSGPLKDVESESKQERFDTKTISIARQVDKVSPAKVEFSNKLDFVVTQAAPLKSISNSFSASTAAARSPSASPSTPAAISSSNNPLKSADEVRYLEHGVVLIKPHASTEAVVALVESTLAANHVRIQHRGKLTGAEIARRRIVQKHFFSLYRHAEVADPLDMEVSEEMRAAFRSHFLVEWSAAVNLSQLSNAREAAEYLGVSPAEVHIMCSNSLFPSLRLGKGLFVSLVDADCSDDPEVKRLLRTPLFVLNGFYCSLKDEYERLESTVQYLLIEWDGSQCSWGDLSESVVGCSHPALAAAGSIRGTVHRLWEQLDLESPPDEVNNVVHVSSSAFEGLADRLVWLPAAALHADIFGHRLLSARIPSSAVQKWLLNPMVAGQPVMQRMAGKNAKECLAEAKTLLGKARATEK